MCNGYLSDSVRLSLSLPVVHSVPTIAHSGDDTNIVRVASGISIGQRKPVSDLSDGVGVGLTLSIAIEARVAYSGDNADIVGMPGGIGVGSGEAIGHLTKGVSLRIPLDCGNSQKNLGEREKSLQGSRIMLRNLQLLWLS